MAQYMLSVWHDEEYELDFSGEDAQRQVAQVGEFNSALEEAGAFVFACGLLPASSALVVRPNRDQVVMTDGPYVESKEHIGGFWVIEASDDAAARAWAERGALACERPVELRAVHGE